MNRTLRPGFVLVALAMPFLVGILAFLFAGLLSGMATGVVSALVEQVGQQRLNPLLAGVLGLAPVALLLLILWLGPRVSPRAGWGPTAAWAGLGPIAALEFWAHWEVWTTYLPSRTMPGFPHGLELVIVPLFFAPVGMALGLAIGVWSGRSSEEGAGVPGAEG